MEPLKLDWKAIPGVMTAPEELEFLESVVEKQWRAFDRAGLLGIEIGSFHGQSTVMLAQYCQKLFVIDLWGSLADGINSYGDIGQKTFLPFIQNIVKYGLVDRVFPIVSTSNVLDGLPSFNFDFAFVDGDHTVQGCTQDLWAVEWHLHDEAKLIVHDYGGPCGKAHTVIEAVDAFIEATEWEVTQQFQAMAVLERK